MLANFDHNTHICLPPLTESLNPPTTSTQHAARFCFQHTLMVSCAHRVSPMAHHSPLIWQPSSRYCFLSATTRRTKGHRYMPSKMVTLPTLLRVLSNGPLNNRAPVHQRSTSSPLFLTRSMSRSQLFKHCCETNRYPDHLLHIRTWSL